MDSSGRLWLVQVQGSGDNKAVLIPDPLSSPQEQWQYFGKAEGLASDKIASVAIGADDTLWFGSGYGAEAGSVSRCRPLGDKPSGTTLVADAGYYNGPGSTSGMERFESHDGGLTWSSNPVAHSDEHRDLKSIPAQETLRDPDNDAIMYRVTRGQSIERSTDSGATWTTEVVLPPWTEAQESLHAAHLGYYKLPHSRQRLKSIARRGT